MLKRVKLRRWTLTNPIELPEMFSGDAPTGSANLSDWFKGPSGRYTVKVNKRGVASIWRETLTKQMISFTDPQRAFLKKEAKRLGISVAELVRRIVDEYTEKKRRP